MLFGKFRILGKLALLILVPLLGVVGLSIPVIYERVDAARTAGAISDTVQRATQVSSALIELQEERLLSVGYLLGLVERPALVAQSAEAADVVAHLAEDKSAPVDLRRAIAGAARLESTRQNVLNNAVEAQDVIEDFTGAIDPLIAGLGLAVGADLTTGVGRQVYALERAMRSDDLISQASCWLAAAVVTRPRNTLLANQMLSEFTSDFAQIEALITTSRVYFTDAQYKLYISTQQAFNFRVGTKFSQTLETNPAQALRDLQIKTLFPSLQSVTVLGSFVEKRVAQDVGTTVTSNRESAIRQSVLLGGGAVLLLILVITLSIFMARAVARPLRRLTISADRIARAAESELERVADDEAEAQVRPIRLDPVDVEAQDEIGDLARAFDRVQTTAARLVERQVLGRRNVAQMFGHVGRRTQNLVGRQLSLIDSLERRETDSDRLRELYRLDHMSSRLRRNASALVVLSGGAGANEHMAPLALSDVVRLALGEIEDYTRVEVDIPEDIIVVPAILADLTLLLAELLENATVFSPPHTNVTVSADELRGGARLAIIDRGLGLAPERLAEENARLTRRERLDLAPTEVLGLFVVGRLARRHGIEVTLTDTPDGGLTAWIDLNPSHMVARIENLSPLAPATFPANSAPTIPAPPSVPQIQAPEQVPAYSGALRSNTTEVAITSAGVRSVPGSQQPFDPVVLSRATQIVESGNSWNAFGPGAAPALSSGPGDPYAGQPIYDAEPVYSPGRAYQEPSYPSAGGYPDPAQQVDMGTPIAGRVPAALPALPPAQPTWNIPSQATAPALPSPVVPVIPAPAAPAAPEPERNGSPNPLRRRVPGDQLPVESGPHQLAAPQSQDDALAARAAFDAFEAGVTKAQWDANDTSVSMPAPDLSQSSWNSTPAPSSWNSTPAPSSWNETPAPAPWNETPAPVPAAPPAPPASNGSAQLTRRVPGASLPRDEHPPIQPPAPTTLDPEAVRALMDQFEYGVALALNESQPQHEGQPR
ncbi:sensor histidine kinase [Actinoplanes derwentensis]|uniref:histidine kinase n=1 Tax=Actinoplanes derwentensis TaxID=113562 RepID=A0A1H2CYK3_9ACTN|nr:nitrate- and nitrite sensing domain-containing protein [Actinoplanes derwentensis]GID82821.1 histidine kinase [Actinoplanes derwentensis]SDT75126.1 Signal transduction histidine kinase [Actinoplanes derwentensis]